MGIEPMMSLTIRTVFERARVLSLLSEPGFTDNYSLQAERDVKPSATTT